MRCFPEIHGARTTSLIQLSPTDATLHTKELFVACPGGTVVFAKMTANMNTAALGINALGLDPGEDRATAAKSIESLVVRSRPCDSPRGRKMIDTVCRVYGRFGRQGWYVYAVPALAELASKSLSSRRDEPS